MIRRFLSEFEPICRANAGRVALVSARSGRVWNYGQLFDEVRRYQSVLFDSGLRPGDRLFSLLPDSAEQFIAFLTALWYGLDFCPISPLLTEKEVLRCLDLYRAKAGLVPQTVPAEIASALAATPTKPVTITVPTDDRDRHDVAEPGARGMDPPPPSGRLLLFTSGTTSQPKSIVLNGDRLWSSARAWAGFHSTIGADATFYNILPMSYLGGLFNLGLIPIAFEGSVVLAETSSGSSLLRFWPDVAKHGVNVLWLPPTVVRALLTLHEKRPKVPTEQIRVCFLGMAPVTLEEKQRLEGMLDAPVLENFALSETTFLTTEETNNPSQRSPGSVGKALPWADIKLAPLGGDSSRSEIQVKTPFLFEGYLDSAGEVRLQLTEDGYFPTGDLAEFDQDGVLVLKGRSKDMIKRGGYLVALAELEEIAGGHPLVKEAVAVAVPHDFYGESSVICVGLVYGDSSTDEVLSDLRSLITGSIARFKWPEKIAVMRSLPRTQSGKVQKWVLRQWLDTDVGVAGSTKV